MAKRYQTVDTDYALLSNFLKDVATEMDKGWLSRRTEGRRLG